MKIIDILKFIILGGLTLSQLEKAGAMGRQFKALFASPPGWDKDLSLRNVTEELGSCTYPTYWRPETNYKKLCELEDTRYYLKAATALSLTEVFGREFAQKNIGVRAPGTELFFEANGIVRNYFGMPIKREHYIASKEIHGYQAAANLQPSLYGFFNWNKNDGYFATFRNNCVKKIGEDGLVQLMVSATFYDDLNLYNWGYDAQGLVLIDVDTMPNTLSGFFDTATSNLKTLKDMGIALSLNNLKKMRATYLKMQHKSLPKIHNSVDITEQLYLTLTDAYIAACDYAIERVKTVMPELTKSEYSANINSLLIEGLREVSLEYDNTFYRAIRNYIF